LSKCQTCEYYRYSAGVSRSISEKLGKQFPTSPTNYCDYANISWPRNSAKVIKPRGTKCDYKLKYMRCDACGKVLRKGSDAWMILTSKSYICNGCGGRKEETN